MCRKFIILIFFIISSLGIMAEEVPSVIGKLYQTMQKMSEASDDIQAFEYRSMLLDCFKGYSEGGILSPNDFNEWGYDNELVINSNVYIHRFYELAYKKKVIRLTKYVIQNYQPILNETLRVSNNELDEITQTVVKRTLSDGNKARTFTDTLIVRNEKIISFKNEICED